MRPWAEDTATVCLYPWPAASVRKRVCLFEPLNLWWFVMQQQKAYTNIKVPGTQQDGSKYCWTNGYPSNFVFKCFPGVRGYIWIWRRRKTWKKWEFEGKDDKGKAETKYGQMLHDYSNCEPCPYISTYKIQDFYLPKCLELFVEGNTGEVDMQRWVLLIVNERGLYSKEIQ